LNFWEIGLAYYINNSLHGLFFYHKLQSDSDEFLLIIKGTCIAVMLKKRNFFLFDSHSRNGKRESSPNGTSTLIKFSGKKVLKTFIKSNFINASDENVQYEYEIQYLKVNKENKIAAAGLSCLQNKKSFIYTSRN